MMKVLTLFLFAGCLQLSANSWSQSISLSLSNATLVSAFNEIQQQTPYHFVYTNEQLAGTSKISINVQNGSLEKVLELCFKDQPLEYSIEDKYIIVRAKEKKTNPPPLPDNDVKGKVLNEKDEPVVGATIAVKGSQKATASDNKGEFLLANVPAGSVIIISSIGYEAREIIIGNNRYLNIHLETTVSGLDEMVIKGYYSTSKRLNTGSVSKVTAEEIAKEPVSNPLSALQGRVSGLYIEQNTGIPGGRFTVRIRGQNSIANGNDPLYIVNGIPYGSASMVLTGGVNINGGSPLNYLNPADIESIEVLKDGDATAIYGSRGANGVIIITTKSGKAGKTKLELNVYTGAGKIPERLNLLTTPEYLAMRNEAFANDKVAKSSTNAPDIFVWDTSRYTDWQKLLVGGTDHIVNAQLNISGGNANTQFLVGGGYYRESTVFPGEFSSQKGSTIFNVVNTSENKRFKIIFGASFQLNINSLPVSDLFTTAIQLPPDTPPIYDSAGKLNWAGGFSNPYSALQVKYSGRSENLFSNAVLSYAVIKGLSIKSGFGYNQTSLTENTTTPLSSLSPSSTSTSGSSIFANNKINTWIIEPQLEYQRTIGKGNLTILAGGTLQNNTRQGQSLSATGFASDDLLGSIKAATKITVNSNLFTQYKYAAVFGRINYNFKEKYLINLTGRRDGSSRFGPGKQFANFGAAGSAWIFSKENFVMKYLKFLSFGKLRASYGTAGNDQIADYGYVDLYNSTSYSYGGGAGLSPVNLFNPDFSWEINKKLEVGIELGFLNDKIFLNVEYYKNRSSSQLVGLPLAPTAGFITLQANLPAKVQNSGLEFEFSATLLKTKKLHWTGSVNLSVPYNKLIAYPDIASSPYAQAYIVGKSLFLAKRIHYTGVDPTTGIYLFEDVNGNGSVNDLVDRQALKKLTQVYFGGMKNNIRYKQWEFDMLVQFVRQTGNSYMAIFNAPGYRSNQPDIVWGRWQRPGDVTNIQKFTQGGSSSTAYSNSIASDLLINTDASFIRLKNASLSWSLPVAWKTKLHLGNGKLYIEGQNLFTRTKYLKGLDPESRGTMPALQWITIGIQLTF